MTTFARLHKLTWRQRTQLGVALVLLPATAVALRLFAFERVHALMVRPRGQVAPPFADDRARELARMVAAAAQHGPYRATCLPQALVLQALLARDGITSEFRLGVRRTAGAVEAHSWVEYEGAPLSDSPNVHRRFAAFARTTSRPASRDAR